MKTIFSSLKSVALFAICLSAIPTSAQAALAQVTAVPSGWRLQNYVPEGIALYFTGATECGGSQALILPPNATTADKDRLWSLVMTAKAASRKIFIFYESTNCQIQSFGFIENG